MDKKYTKIIIWTLWLLTLMPVFPLRAENVPALINLIGKRDAVILANPDGNIAISKNESQKLVPASTLKILTALAAFHYLGADYRFKTKFFMDHQNNLKIKGYGDPLLISEIMPHIADALIQRINEYHHLIMDDSHFTHPLTIPGISSTTEPYDAPNGALCVNFNTVNYDFINGKYQSAEPQTPLLPFALNRIKKSGLKKGRIVLTHIKNECTLYAGHLFEYFLKKKGIQVNGQVKLGKITGEDLLIHTYVSRFSMAEYIKNFLEFSNNYMTNQILITMGVKQYGPPGTLSKGVRALLTYSKQNLGLNRINILEGSGISRQNRISAHDLFIVLEAFKPYYRLMRNEGKEYYKTGTLKGVNNRAGYIQDRHGRLHSYVVFFNTPGKYSPQAMKHLIKMVK